MDPQRTDRERAEALLAQGAYAEAAAEMRRLGDLVRAQALYERIWDYRSAAEVARERGDRPALLRLLLLSRDTQEAQRLHAQLAERSPPHEKEAAARIYEERHLWVEAAQLREALGEIAAARELYRRARCRLDVARLSEQLRDFREAALGYEQHLRGEADPLGRACAGLGLARVLLRFGQPEDAVRRLQEARRLLPAEAEALREEIDGTLSAALLALGLPGVARRLRPGQAEPPAGQPGLVLQRYRIVRLIGSGAMGRVYLAEDTLLGREVAIKIVPQGSGAAGEAYQRFVREAQVVRALRHPAIVAVHDFHEAEGILVMEHMAGGTLADAGLPLPPALCRRVLLSVVDGLQAAHSAGVIHRDIKPQNIFLTATREAKLGDFGAAHLFDLHATQTAGFIGTLAYMAPEQISGAPLTFATDIYGLGVTAFQILTGRLPFSGPDFIGQHLSQAPPPPSAVRPGLPAAWDALCEKALRKHPEERFASLAALRQALMALPRSDEDPEPVRGAPAPSAEDDQHLSPAPAREPYRIEGEAARTGYSVVLLGTDVRLGRPVLIERFAEGLLQRGPAHLAWLRLLARFGGPLLQRVLRIDTSAAAAQVVYEAPVGAPAARLMPAEAERLRRLLGRLHEEGAVHGAVARSIVRQAALPVLLISGRGPLGWGEAPPSAAEDLEALRGLTGPAGPDTGSGS